MAYYSGSAVGFEALRAAIFGACIDNGWSLAGDILSKGSAFVRLYITESATTSEGAGLIAQGGTGESGGELIGGTDVRPRIGLPGLPGAVPAIVWPVEYNIHLFTEPEEVYCIIRTSVDRFFYLAFGISDVPGVGGTGLWVSGSSYRGYSSSVAAGWSSAPESGFEFYYAIGEGCPCPFWRIQGGAGLQYASDVIHVGLDSVGWASPSTAVVQSVGSVNASLAAAPHIARSPSPWNQDSPLIPIQAYLQRASSKRSLVLDLRNARYLRINNYAPGQLISLGTDTWKIYPFYQKNSSQPDGGIVISHTGTLGWAIRYDGP
ncbi:hypothetical protein N5C56_10110 [Pseudomonas chengduensis]|nr:hypothetical protein [Pseudomonas chengduensis]MDH1281055.1 hypothetical protein [Pseudomonas chengduensis]